MSVIKILQPNPVLKSTVFISSFIFPVLWPPGSEWCWQVIYFQDANWWYRCDRGRSFPQRKQVRERPHILPLLFVKENPILLSPPTVAAYIPLPAGLSSVPFFLFWGLGIKSFAESGKVLKLFWKMSLRVAFEYQNPSCSKVTFKNNKFGPERLSEFCIFVSPVIPKLLIHLLPFLT